MGRHYTPEEAEAVRSTIDIVRESNPSDAVLRTIEEIEKDLRDSEATPQAV